MTFIKSKGYYEYNRFNLKSRVNFVKKEDTMVVSTRNKKDTA